MENTHEKLQRALKCIKDAVKFKPHVAIVLGSGLGSFAESIEITQTLDYSDIEGFPISTVSGHRGRFVFGYIDKIPVAIMQGRVHFYEGYPMEDVVLPIRLLGLLGAKILFLTNAAGGINKSFKPGDLMIIRDHISSFVPSPLKGPNLDELGVRFPDMSEVYSTALRKKLQKAGENTGIPLSQGVYLQLSGPNFETPAEIKMCALLGADAVGMSTAAEAMTGRHMGMEVCAVSCISNLAAGLSSTPLSHEEVSETAQKIEHQFKALLKEAIGLFFS